MTNDDWTKNSGMGHTERGSYGPMLVVFVGLPLLVAMLWWMTQ